MSSGKVNDEINALIKKWEKKQPSTISDHGKHCCLVAREWLLAMDRSLLADANPISAPCWIREKYDWGPSQWPLYWCEIMELNTLDCGGFAALAREIFVNRGIVTFPVQLIQRFSEQAAHHWRQRWLKAGQSADWIIGPYVYHEACAIVVYKNYIKIWDPTDNLWIYPNQSTGYGVTLAVRVIFTDMSTFIWNDCQIRSNQWTKVTK